MQDLCAHDAVYHNISYSNFRNGWQIPWMFSTGEPALKKVCPGPGCPKNTLCLEAFQYVLHYLNSTDIEQVTVPQFVQVMQSKLTSGEAAYSAKYMKKKLFEHYGDGIVIAEKRGTADVVTLKDTPSSNFAWLLQKSIFIKWRCSESKNYKSSCTAYSEWYQSNGMLKRLLPKHWNWITELFFAMVSEDSSCTRFQEENFHKSNSSWASHRPELQNKDCACPTAAWTGCPNAQGVQIKISGGHSESPRIFIFICRGTEIRNEYITTTRYKSACNIRT